MTDENYEDSGSLEQYKERTANDIIEGIEPYEKARNLEALYHEYEWSQTQIADFYGIDQATISRAMDAEGVETRPPMHLRTPSISKSTRADGTVQFHVPDGEGGHDRFNRHELVALLAVDGDGEWAFDPSDVFADDTHIHHEMASPIAFDVPENLDVVSPTEHAQIHATGGVTNPEIILVEMRHWPRIQYGISPNRSKIHKLRQLRGRLNTETGSSEVYGDADD
jgi:hypothetical protein